MQVVLQKSQMHTKNQTIAGNMLRLGRVIDKISKLKAIEGKVRVGRCPQTWSVNPPLQFRAIDQLLVSKSSQQ